jgi:ATP-binding protein involved in chromosome partitioning
MNIVTEQDVLDALRTVREPKRGNDVVSLGMISGLSIADGAVRFAIEVNPDDGPSLEPLRKAAEDAVSGLHGVGRVTAVLTAHRAQPAGPPRGQAQPPHGEKLALPGVRAIVAVASGKGGVGKSTVAANLAVGLTALGLKVGLLDCDIYGPSMPLMMGVKARPSMSGDGKRLTPPESFGVKVMSMGFLAAERTPLIWRGPMVSQAVDQMLRGVVWEPLDILVVDMPPGTGDAQLTLTQRVPLSGAVIVSTPQDIALLDARRGLAMFRQVEVPILGIVENMSYFLCPHCGERSDIFSHGGAEREAAESNVAFLGAIPLDIAIRDTSDSGRPITATAPESAHAKAFRTIAEKVWHAVTSGTSARKAPRIVIQ